jgi:hypothetical protein
MRGRWPSGPEYIDKLQGSAETKERLKVIFETMYGDMRLLAACAQLEVGETRFHQLRERALQGAILAIEPRAAGRPSQTCGSEAEQVRALQARVKELELALHEAQVREEIALVLPHLRRSPAPVLVGSAAKVEGKKTRRRRATVHKRRRRTCI